MKKILISLSIIGVVGAIVVGATTAYFSDTETSRGNTVTAGTVDLQVSTDGDNYYDDPNVPVLIGNNGDLKPSEWIEVPVWLKNVGMNGGIKDIHFKNVQDDGGAYPEPEKEKDPQNLINDLSNQIEVDINGRCLDQNNDRKPDTLKELESHNFKLGELPVGQIERDYISFHIKSDAGNEYQGDKTKFDIEFSLLQLNAPNNLEEPNYIPCGTTSE